MNLFSWAAKTAAYNVRNFAKRFVEKRELKYIGGEAEWLQKIKSWAWGPDVAESKSVVMGCIRFIVNEISTLDLGVFENLPDGGSRVAMRHPLYNVLHIKPNSKMTTPEWHQWAVRSLLVTGNAYSAIKVEQGKVTELIPLIGHMQIKVRETGSLLYVFTPRNTLPGQRQQTFELEEWEVLHYRYMSADGIVGRSPIQVAKDMIENEAVHLAYDTNHLENGAFPSALISMTVPEGASKGEGRLAGMDNPEQRALYQKYFENRLSGLNNVGKIALIPYDYKAEMFSLSPTDSQALEGQAFASNRVAGVVFGLPGAIFNLSEPKFSNAKEQMRTIAKTVIAPLLVLMEKRNDVSLFSAAQRGRFFTKYNMDSLLRGDPKESAEVDQILVKSGIITTNEARAKRDLPGVAGGDVFWKQLQDVPAEAQIAFYEDQSNRKGSGTGQEANKSLIPAVVMRGIRPLFEQAVERFVNLEYHALGKKISHVRKGKMEEFEAWRDEFYRKHAGIIVKNLLPSSELHARTLADVGGYGEVNEETILAAAKTAAGIEAAEYCGISITGINGALEAGDSDEERADNLDKLLNSWSVNRIRKTVDKILGAGK